MKIGVAMPLHWAASVAYEMGSSVIFLGNGSDELFAGYRRYSQKISSEELEQSIFYDVLHSHRINFDRDFKVCSDNGVELRLPFADEELIEFGLSLPLEFKLSLKTGSPRKLILRELAMKIGIPKEIAYRRKKAIQYSTRVNRALKRFARKRGKSFQTFLNEKLEFLKEKVKTSY
jgi:asparagine synthase (glutamine-hydrolysing)